MPIHQIQVNEYECALCGYKWINRVNGKDGTIPSKCAKCKRSAWINGEGDVKTPEEVGLRQRIKHFYQLYNGLYEWWYKYEYIGVEWPADLSDRFLNIEPRPSIDKLRKVIYPLGWDTKKHEYMVPDPERPGYLKYDSSKCTEDPDRPGKSKYNSDYSTHEYLKLLKQEAQKRIQLIIHIMKSRNADYDPEPIIKQQREGKTFTSRSSRRSSKAKKII